MYRNGASVWMYRNGASVYICTCEVVEYGACENVTPERDNDNCVTKVEYSHWERLHLVDPTGGNSSAYLNPENILRHNITSLNMQRYIMKSSIHMYMKRNLSKFFITVRILFSQCGHNVSVRSKYNSEWI